MLTKGEQKEKMSNTIGYDGPKKLFLDASIPDYILPRMEIRLKKEYLFETCESRLDVALACITVAEYLETLGNERIVSINCTGGCALNYCVAGEGSDKSVDLNASASNILKAALLSGAESVVLLHNHPQGLARPSQSDLNGLCYMAHLFDIADIRIIDMYVVGLNAPMFSCKEHYPEYLQVNQENHDKFLPENRQIVKEETMY